MKKVESLFIGTILVVATITTICLLPNDWQTQKPESNKYGSFLAAQHAVYVNDFESASKFVTDLSDIDYKNVSTLHILSEFLAGKLPENVSELKNDKTAPAKIIYDAYLVINDSWDDVRTRHEKDSAALMAPIKIWAGIATDRKTKTLKFIDELATAPAWKSFVRGQIYAEQGDTPKAAKEFKSVAPEFMNINDYLYVMSFYTHNNMDEEAKNLRTEFINMPGGMYLTDYDYVPDWSEYAGYKKQLAFSLLQTVSHTKIMMHSDLALVMLQFANIIAPNTNKDANTYYIGQYLYNTHGNYMNEFNKIDKQSPFYPFVQSIRSEHDISELKTAVRNNPLFVPTLQQLVAHEIQNGNKHAAIKTINRALRNKQLSDKGRLFFTKIRANIYFTFGDYKKAQSDLHSVSDTFIDADVILLQAKIWAAANQEIETAYEYVMKVITQHPTDVVAWDTLGQVVYVREGIDAALEIVENVASVSTTCSSLFEHLGDMYVEIGEFELAKDAYLTAIDLSDDGMVVVPYINKKLRKIK
ncbi:MAG: hypothetical protein KBS86_01640 [Proteobacteria bacterium]|nr:hypothetical protein [Candidatus Enterousia scatequi]